MGNAMTTELNPSDLPENVELIRGDDGSLVAAYVKVADGQAAYSVRPRSDVGLFVYCDELGMPVGVKLLEQVDALVVTEVATTLLSDDDGKPSGVGRKVKHHVITKDDLRRFFMALAAALQALGRAKKPPLTPA